MSAAPGPRDERAHWEARYTERAAEPEHAPSPWVIRQCLALSPHVVIVDVAGGTGRHAVPLARAGRCVIVMDFIARAVQAARRRERAVLGIVADVRALPMRNASVEAIVCVNFLDRALFPSFVAMLRPGGVLVYETFTRDHLDLVQAGRAHGPRNVAFLLAPGELRELVAPLAIREYAEGVVQDEAGERHIARIVAVKA